MRRARRNVQERDGYEKQRNGNDSGALNLWFEYTIYIKLLGKSHEIRYKGFVL